jgi:hypothetical protein
VRMGRRLALSLALTASLVEPACRNQGKSSEPAPAPATPSAARPPAPEPSTAGTLPEDPEAGARSAAQWRQHLEREERERRLGYDHRKLHEHEEVLKKLRGTRRSYDGASSKSAVQTAEREFRTLRPTLAALFEAIDHWGTNSKVLPDYRKLVDTFSDAYPNARIAALAGDGAELARVGRDVDERFRAVDAWLHDAEESADE